MPMPRRRAFRSEERPARLTIEEKGTAPHRTALLGLIDVRAVRAGVRAYTCR